ncbi:MAG TPA: hypothetical protein VF174_01790 [Micromonosporaceae bacterium]
MTIPGPAGSPPPAVPLGGPPAPGPDVPSPPAGPGVRPPFAAPPIEGRATRLWLGISTALLAVVLICGGGGTLLIGLNIVAGRALQEQARVVVGDYLDAVSQDRFTDAYALLCDERQQQESRPAFERRVRAEPEIVDYRVGEPRISGQTELVVDTPVEVTYPGGGRDTLEFRLVQDRDTGDLEICEIG